MQAERGLRKAQNSNNGLVEAAHNVERGVLRENLHSTLNIEPSTFNAQPLRGFLTRYSHLNNKYVAIQLRHSRLTIVTPSKRSAAWGMAVRRPRPHSGRTCGTVASSATSTRPMAFPAFYPRPRRRVTHQQPPRG